MDKSNKRNATIIEGQNQVNNKSPPNIQPGTWTNVPRLTTVNKDDLSTI